jgi:hypothetical protein
MKELRENIPLYTVIIIGISLLYLILYYAYLGIDIVSYIEPTEALVLSFPAFIYALVENGIVMIVGLIICLILLVIITIFDIVRKRFQKEKIPSSSAATESNDLVDNEGFPWFSAIIVLIWIVSITFVIISAIQTKDYTSLINSMLFYCILGLFYVNRPKTHKILSKVILRDKQVFNLVYLTLITSLSVALLARHKAQDIISNKHYTQVAVSFENNQKIITNDTLRYVGKTKNYIFFYRTKQNESTIYPLEKAINLNMMDGKPL